jgi:hypothetical protein
MAETKKKLSKVAKSPWFIAGAGFVLGALLILVIRFASYQPEEAVHYHANFGVYINGQREQFVGPRYYEESADSSCDNEGHDEDAAGRMHMHNNVNDVVHVHDHLVTWGHFFQSIGWAFDKDYAKTASQVLTAEGQNKVTFTLNGQPVEDINNLIIESEDRLLINYGNTPQDQLDEYYKSVASTAGKYNTSADPASCGAGESKDSFSDRLKNLF